MKCKSFDFEVNSLRYEQTCLNLDYIKKTRPADAQALEYFLSVKENLAKRLKLQDIWGCITSAQN